VSNSENSFHKITYCGGTVTVSTQDVFFILIWISVEEANCLIHLALSSSQGLAFIGRLCLSV